jgi:ABC-type multidrug transport system fused ATPase/permease subunit
MTLSKSFIRLLSHLSSRRRWQLVGLIVLMLIGALAEMATLGAVVPFLALLADAGMANKYPLLQTMLNWFGATQGNVLFSAVILFSIIALGAALIRMLLMWSSMRFIYGLGADIGGEVYLRTLYQPYSWHVSRNSSEILAGIDKVNVVVGGVLTPLMQGTVALVMSFGVFAMLLAIDTPAALIAGIGFSMLYGVTTLTLRQQLVRDSKIISSNATHRVQAVQEGLGGIRDVLLDGTQPIYHKQFASVDYALRRAQASNAVIAASPRYVIEAAGMVLIVALAYWLSSREGGLTSAIPVLGALAIGSQKLLPQMQLVYSSWSSISGCRSQLYDVLNLLSHPMPSEYSQPTASDLGFNSPKTVLPLSESVRVIPQQMRSQSTDTHPLIALRNVSFRYKTDGIEVLYDINLEIPKFARVGVKGKTGSGKSTLIDLILGLLDPTDGQIVIDGQPLTAGNRRAWQGRTAHVPQAIYLADTSIAENIAFGVPVAQIDMSLVKDAAAKAQLSEFVEALPQQYQNRVGERGISLSGGQRQRIGIARALYKQAEVIIFDEATSALDNNTEEAVMQAIDSLSKDLTILIIAHRLSTLDSCQYIIDLDQIQLRGKPETLVKPHLQDRT